MCNLNSQVGYSYNLLVDGSTPNPPGNSLKQGTGFQINWTGLSQVGTYTVIAMHPLAGCSAQMSGSASISTLPAPQIFTVNGGGTFCVGEVTPVSLQDSRTGISYQLRLNGIDVRDPLSGTDVGLTWESLSDPGTYSIKATDPTTQCSAIMGGNAVITRKGPAFADISGSTSIADDNITISANTGTAFSYQWRRDEDILNGQLSAALPVSESGSYSVTISAEGCSVTSNAHFVAKTARRYYNGNVASTRWRTEKVFGVANAKDFRGMFNFDYDGKYQIHGAEFQDVNFELNSFSSAENVFRLSDISYDPNGNIKTLRRFNEAGVRVHDFHYSYQSNTNKLDSVSGYVNKYTYDTLGQMVGADKAEGDDQYVEYNVSGKVTAVYSDPLKSNKIVEYIYDDRGFRMGKVNVPENKTTWYIRDLSGNVMSIFEQEGTVTLGQTSDSTLVQTEAIIYGSGKIGTYYPYEDGSTNYEITDHLGNVRALLRDNVNIYRATLEDNGVADTTNVRVAEMLYFENLFETEQTDQFMNVTEPLPYIPQPDKVSYLYWNDNAGMQAADKAVGPAIALQVRPGDRLEVETWTRFENKASFTKNFDLAVLSSLLGNTFLGKLGFEGMSASSVSSNVYGALTAAAYQNNEDSTSVPFAYLNYILYDTNMVMTDAGWRRVPLAAGSDAEALYLPGNEPLRLSFDEEIKIQQHGYIYVWVSNQSSETKVWFDDLTVKHTQTIVVQTTDYEAWGDVLREQKSESKIYRYGYQGLFAEQDNETGWSHFELREYDPVIARWTAVDPKRQFFSPYVGMGNNPVSAIDPDGAWVKGGGFWRNLFHSDEMVQAMIHADAVNNVEGWFGNAIEDNEGDANLVVINKKSGFTTISRVNDAGAIGDGVGYYQYWSLDIRSEIVNLKYTAFMETGKALATTYVSEGIGLGAGALISSIRIPVYRVFGGGISNATGEYWSLVNPRLYGSSYRNFAGLPNWNTAAFQVRGSVSIGDILTFGKIRLAAPFHGNFGRLVPELRINASRVRLTYYNGFRIN
jgi:RHS repeat-associated protein